MPKKPKRAIELKPAIKFEELSIPQKVATWIVNIGRVIIIATELLAFSVFVARLKLDRDLTDLSDHLENQLLVLRNSRGLEDKVRDYQTRINLIRRLRAEQKPLAPVVEFLVKEIPGEVFLTGLLLTEGSEVTLSAKTFSARSFALLIANLREEAAVKKIAVVAGRFEAGEQLYSFTLRLRLNYDRL